MCQNLGTRQRASLQMIESLFAACAIEEAFVVYLLAAVLEHICRKTCCMDFALVF